MSDAEPPRGVAAGEARARTCLITGASGFIGGRLAARLLADGYRVRCLVRAGSDTSRLARLDVKLVRGELGDERSLTDAAAGATHVVHCAALVSDWATVAEIKRANVAGTRNLLRAAADASVGRFVHVSSTDVYGHPGGAAIDESHEPSGFANWYSQTKLEAEAEVASAREARALDAVIVRPATVYGPGSKDVIGEIARAIRAGNMLLIDRGRPVAGLCYVDNLVDAVSIALRHDGASGQAFNVSDGLDVTWRQLTDDLAGGLGCSAPRWSMPYRLAHAVGFAMEHGYRLLRESTGLSSPPLLSRQAVQVLGRDQRFSNAKARELLGWEPHVGYSEGLDATLAWLRDEHLAGA